MQLVNLCGLYKHLTSGQVLSQPWGNKTEQINLFDTCQWRKINQSILSGEEWIYTWVHVHRDTTTFALVPHEIIMMNMNMFARKRWGQNKKWRLIEVNPTEVIWMVIKIFLIRLWSLLDYSWCMVWVVSVEDLQHRNAVSLTFMCLWHFPHRVLFL